MWHRLSGQSLSRVGILLNFIAGILLTPSIIGLDRLRRLEEWAETKLQGLHSRSLQVLMPYEPLGKWRLDRDPSESLLVRAFNYVIAMARYLIGGIYLAILGVLPAAIIIWLATVAATTVAATLRSHYNPILLALVISVAISVLFVILGFGIVILASQLERLWMLRVAFILVVAAIWPAFIRQVPESLRYNWSNIVFWTTSRIVTRLERHDALLTAMTVVGMALFVIGNALQFAATYGDASPASRASTIAR